MTRPGLNLMLLVAGLMLLVACDGGVSMMSSDDLREIGAASDLSVEPKADSRITAKQAYKIAEKQIRALKRKADPILIKTGAHKVTVDLQGAGLKAADSWVILFADRAKNEVIALGIDATGIIDAGVLNVTADDLDHWDKIWVEGWEIDSNEVLTGQGFVQGDITQALNLMLISRESEAVWLQFDEGELIAVDSAKEKVRYVGASLSSDIRMELTFVVTKSGTMLLWKEIWEREIAKRIWF